MSNETMCGLIEAVAVQNDRNAFTELFHYFAPRFKAYALGIGCGNKAAEDVAQDAMITVWRRADTFNRKTGGASAWMFTIVRDARLDLFRREHQAVVEGREAERQPAGAIEAAEACEGGKPDEDARGPLKGLPKEQFEVLHKAFFEGKSHAALAEELHLPPETVTSRIRLALTHLRRFPTEAIR
jgi:RNA polymerase sigma-70 factor (ECF subfamily)